MEQITILFLNVSFKINKLKDLVQINDKCRMLTNAIRILILIRMQPTRTQITSLARVVLLHYCCRSNVCTELRVTSPNKTRANKFHSRFILMCKLLVRTLHYKNTGN